MKPRSMPIKVRGNMLTPRGPTDRTVGKLSGPQTLSNPRIIQRLPGGKTYVDPMHPGQKRVKQIPRTQQTPPQRKLVSQKREGIFTRMIKGIFRTSNKSAGLGQKVGQRVIRK
jgi:hypothetical protein